MTPFDCRVTVPNARAVAYDEETERFLVHSPRFYGGAWIDKNDVKENEG